MCALPNAELLRTLKRRKLMFYGHTMRHESLQKILLEGLIEGKRGIGKPRKRWEDDIRQALETSTSSAGELAQRRDFRTAVITATSEPD